MIPTTTGAPSPPITNGDNAFHVVVDNGNRTFSVDGPDGPNGVLLHYEVHKVARALKRKFCEFDIRAKSEDHVLAEMQNSFPAYKFVGNWASANSN